MMRQDVFTFRTNDSKNLVSIATKHATGRMTDGQE